MEIKYHLVLDLSGKGRNLNENGESEEQPHTGIGVESMGTRRSSAGPRNRIGRMSYSVDMQKEIQFIHFFLKPIYLKRDKRKFQFT